MLCRPTSRGFFTRAYDITCAEVGQLQERSKNPTKGHHRLVAYVYWLWHTQPQAWWTLGAASGLQTSGKWLHDNLLGGTCEGPQQKFLKICVASVIFLFVKRAKTLTFAACRRTQWNSYLLGDGIMSFSNWKYHNTFILDDIPFMILSRWPWHYLFMWKYKLTGVVIHAVRDILKMRGAVNMLCTRDQQQHLISGKIDAHQGYQSTSPWHMESILIITAMSKDITDNAILSNLKALKLRQVASRAQEPTNPLVSH